jgi:hypothetical protein
LRKHPAISRFRTMGSPIPANFLNSRSHAEMKDFPALKNLQFVNNTKFSYFPQNLSVNFRELENNKKKLPEL